MPELALADTRVAFEHRDGEQHESRRAEAALKRPVLVERLLHRMELVGPRQTLDRPNAPSLGLHCKHQARPHRRAVEKDGARAADAVLAPEVRSRETVLADRVGEGAPDRELEPRRLAVDRQVDRRPRFARPIHSLARR